MIKTKYVVGDVVVVNGKQEVVQAVIASQYSLYEPPTVTYDLSNGLWLDDAEI